MCPRVWQELGLGEGPQWLLQSLGAHRSELISNTEMGFGTKIAALLGGGDLVLRVTEEVADLLPRVMVSRTYPASYKQVMK